MEREESLREFSTHRVQLETAIEETKRKIPEEERYIAELCREKTELETELVSSKKDCVTFKETMEVLCKQVKKNDKEVEDLQSKMYEKEQRVREIEVKLKPKEEELEIANQRKVKLETQLTSKVEKYEAACSQISDLKISKESLEGQLRQMGILSTHAVQISEVIYRHFYMG